MRALFRVPCNFLPARMRNRSTGSRNQRRARLSSGRERLLLALLLVKKRHRLEAIVTGRTVPKITHAAWTRFDPVRLPNRFAALCAGIVFGQVQRSSGHRAPPICSFLALALKSLRQDRGRNEGSSVGALIDSHRAICPTICAGQFVSFSKNSYFAFSLAAGTCVRAASSLRR